VKQLPDTEADAVFPSPDSTNSAVHGIDSRHMTFETSREPAAVKRAALYARVSDDLAAKEGTIESQVLALKKQIAAANHVLVKEYIDNGFSGTRFDRPELDQMRKDLKTDLFDVIYFHQADRIAREVVIQTIVIEEILKHRKRLVINGKDFEKNPENNFTLQILGSVAELERAKIIERTTRGRQYRLSQGQLMGAGTNTFGYDYIRKSPTGLPRMLVNEREAAIVRRVFETYADTQVGLDKIAQRLEEEGVTTKKGRKLWRRSFLKAMLDNETYLGTKYYNKMRTIREYANPIYGIEHSTKRYAPRKREEWVCVQVPQIISRELFERVQKRKADNRKRYRNPRQQQLLSTLVRCAGCGMSAFGYRRWERSHAKGPLCIIHKYSYRCSWTHRGRLHSRQSDIKRCDNPEVKGQLLENCVFAAIEQVMLDPAKLRECMDYFKEDARDAGERIEKELRAIDGRLADLEAKKQRIIDIYLSGDLSRDGYAAKNRELDGIIEALRERATELSGSTALLDKRSEINAAVARHCSGARARFRECSDTRNKRQFLLDYIQKVAFLNDKVSIHGRIPLRGHNQDAPGFLPFCIEREITKEDRKQERMRTIEAVHMQQAMSRITLGHSTSLPN
jgi:site-specific DNA recombinase